MLGSSLQKIYPKHACARNRHKSQYNDNDYDDGDDVVTLDSNIELRVWIYFIAFSILLHHYYTTTAN